jgi:hypothetical protein
MFHIVRIEVPVNQLFNVGVEGYMSVRKHLSNDYLFTQHATRFIQHQSFYEAAIIPEVDNE